MVGRALKGLEDTISYSPVDWYLETGVGWKFSEKSPDPIGNKNTLKEYYHQSEKDYNGKITVPVLYDKKTGKIVNNESAEILRIINSEFNDFAKNKDLDLYPEHLREKIDEINTWIYDTINNGVYRCGFATSQEAYDEAFEKLFTALDRVEDILSKSRYLIGNTLTEADVRLWTTLLRFDPVYVTHFKTNKKRIADYPNIFGFTRELYQIPEIKKTVDMTHIKNHYFVSHVHINPNRIVPGGPDVDFDAPHDRTKFQ